MTNPIDDKNTPINDRNEGTDPVFDASIGGVPPQHASASDEGFVATDRTASTSDTSIHNVPDSDVTPDHSADKLDDDAVSDPAADKPAADTSEAAGATGGAGESDSHETQKAFLGRAEFTPLYAMAGLADLAASVVRDLVNEQIAAYNARRNQSGSSAGDRPTTDGEGADSDAPSDQAKSEFNAFLEAAQLRTQELYDQALQQYSHLADRGRVAVGDVVENAKAQRVKAGDKIDDGAQESAEDVSKVAERLADRVAAAAKAAADRVGRTAKVDKADAAEEPTMGSDVSDDLADEPVTGTGATAGEPTTLEDGTTTGSVGGSADTGSDTTTWPTGNDPK
ncbi:MAG: hypothetical protein L0G99_00665 [Propionibacteriales bacterium]|nr:hypothetical protein [Propionibacteriales bacterium]